eukprot:g2626.t1
MQQQQGNSTERRGIGGMSMTHLKNIPAILVGVLCLIGFILQMAGVGDSHKSCNDSFSESRCHDHFRFYWWTVFFQAIMVCILAVMTAANKLSDTRQALLSFFTISTVQIILSANYFLRNNYGEAQPNDGDRTAAAGFVLSAIANFLIILSIGVPEIPLTNVSQMVFVRGQTTIGQQQGGVSTGTIPTYPNPPVSATPHGPAVISVPGDNEKKATP